MEKEETSASLWIGDFIPDKDEAVETEQTSIARFWANLCRRKSKRSMGALRAPKQSEASWSLTSKHQTRYVLMLENDADA